MRLIDADALIKTMKKVETDYEDAMTCPSWWTAYSVISEQPTAYDVEKVVAELEEEKTGIVRRVDDLGRILIPKEVRRTLKITDGQPMEVFVDGDSIVLKKCKDSEV